MRVVPDLEEDRLRLTSNVALRRALSHIEVPPAQDERKRHAGKRGGGGGKTPVLLALDSAHHGGHKLAQQNNSKQTETFRKMRCVRRKSRTVLRRQPGSQEIDD